MQSEIALITAAGMGVRMLPLTKEIAKPLIKINGIPMIETIIEALNMRSNISTIYIVVGYKKEQFKYLTLKYGNIVLIENEEYSYKNNISSLKAAENVLGNENCFICEADLYISDNSIFRHEFKKSCYFGKFIEGYSDDWVFELHKDRIVNIKKGGNNLYNMGGVSYWLKDDILKITRAISSSYSEPNHQDLFWDEVVKRELNDMNVEVYPIKPEQVVEIDTVDELKNINLLLRTQENI